MSYRRIVNVLLIAALLGVSWAQTRLVIGTATETDDLDPRTATSIAALHRLRTVSEPLLVNSPDMELTPRLAESWEYSNDGLTLTFSLREGISFHHGRTLTSEDVRYTFEWILDEANDSPHRSSFMAIESIDTPDDLTVIFNFSEPNVFLLNQLSNRGIVPADLGDDPDFGLAPVGTGPFVFEEWVRDDRFVARAFDDYWGGRAAVDEVVFRPIPENSTRLLALEAGEIDIMQGDVQASEVTRLEEDERFTVQRVPSLSYTYVAFNVDGSNEMLSDVRVRQALSHLMPREAIVANILEGIGRPGISMLSPDLPWFSDDVPRFDYNPERARELLAEAGIEEGELSFTLHVQDNAVRTQIAEIFAFEAQQVGIDITIIVEELAALQQRINQTRDFELFILGWAGMAEPDQAMFRQWHSEGSLNRPGYSNPELDALLERGRTLDPQSEESLELYAQAQRIILEDATYVFVFYTEEIGVHRSDLSGWQVHPGNTAAWQDLHLVRFTND